MKILRSESGASIVEFAIVAPFLALLLVGTIDFGRYMYDGILLANAARAGVQYGAQNLQTAVDSTGIQNAAYADASNLTVHATTTTFCKLGVVATTCSASGAVPYVQVIASGTWSPMISYPGLPASMTLSQTAVMRVENQ
jgi:Flp pilus assembly protein TadG